MNMQKPLIIASAAALVSTLVVGGSVMAQSASTPDSLVDKVAQKFNLNKEEVKKVINEHQDELKVEHEQKYEERLSQAVKDGMLTEDQKTKILAKHKELMAKREAGGDKREDFKDKTEAERKQFMTQRRAKMDSLRTEIEKWEKDNNIPSGYLTPGSKGGKHITLSN